MHALRKSYANTSTAPTRGGFYFGYVFYHIILASVFYWYLANL